MQTSTGSTPGKKPPDAAFGAFLFALGVAIFALLLEFLNLFWLITLLMGFTAGLLIAGGLYLIIKEAARSSKCELEDNLISNSAAATGNTLDKFFFLYSYYV